MLTVASGWGNEGGTATSGNGFREADGGDFNDGLDDGGRQQGDAGDRTCRRCGQGSLLSCFVEVLV